MKTLKVIYHAIFELYLHYSHLAWAQISSPVKIRFILQWLAYFLVSLLIRQLIQRIQYSKITSSNWSGKLALNKSKFHQSLSTILKKLSMSTNFHPYNFRCFNQVCLVEPPHKTKLCGWNSVNDNYTCTWNYSKQLNDNKFFYQVSPSNLKHIIKKNFINKYNWLSLN